MADQEKQCGHGTRKTQAGLQPKTFILMVKPLKTFIFLRKTFI